MPAVARTSPWSDRRSGPPGASVASATAEIIPEEEAVAGEAPQGPQQISAMPPWMIERRRMRRDATGPGGAPETSASAGTGPGSQLRGVAYAAAAYLIWGTFPLYFRALYGIPAAEILAHRIAWSAAFLVLLVTAWRRWPDVLGQLRPPGTLARLATSAILIAGTGHPHLR
jgi:hypothetical protein